MKDEGEMKKVGVIKILASIYCTGYLRFTLHARTERVSENALQEILTAVLPTDTQTHTSPYA